jgi:hypothetical protein
MLLLRETLVYSRQAAQEEVFTIFRKQDPQMYNPAPSTDRIITIATVPDVVKDPQIRGGSS